MPFEGLDAVDAECRDGAPENDSPLWDLNGDLVPSLQCRSQPLEQCSLAPGESLSRPSRQPRAWMVMTSLCSHVISGKLYSRGTGCQSLYTCKLGGGCDSYYLGL